MALAQFPVPAQVPARDRALDIASFARGIAGTVIRPTAPAYDEARRVHDLGFDKRPMLIVQAVDSADVARTVVAAREHGLELAVRSGSHSLAGHGTSDGGIVLDLGALKGLHIDPERRRAWVGPGLTAGEVTTALAAHGLAIPFGDAASVGVGGITLGGGIGFLVRKFGLTIDALVSVEIVTADGSLITASESEHPDLFWAVRGGGGNFGVVTRFGFRLYPTPETLSGAIFLPATREVLRGLVPIAASAPDELTVIASVMAAPPAPFIQTEHHFLPTVAILFVYAGDTEAGLEAIAPFREVATPLAEVVAPMPYGAIYEFTREAEKPGRSVVRSLFADGLDDGAIDTILRVHTGATTPMPITQIRILGGAMAEVGAAETAFAHRSAPIMVTIITPYEDPTQADVVEASTIAYHEALGRLGRGVYSNFLANEGDGRVHDAYPGDTYARLARIKRRYDPTNLFRLNQNIRPALAVS